MTQLKHTPTPQQYGFRNKSLAIQDAYRTSGSQYAALIKAIFKERAMVEVPHEWHTDQTEKAVKFPTYGWVPKTAIRWIRKSGKFEGLVLPWTNGYADDFLLIGAEFVKTKGDA